MTDITERLRDFINEATHPIVAEAADEIERLQASLDIWIRQFGELRARYDGAMVEQARQAAEIDRLRAELKEVQQAWYGRCVIIDERDDEIERLRKHIRDLEAIINATTTTATSKPAIASHPITVKPAYSRLFHIIDSILFMA